MGGGEDDGRGKDREDEGAEGDITVYNEADPDRGRIRIPGTTAV